MKINIPSDAPSWATEFARSIELAITAPAESSVRLKALATADLPDPASASHIYGMIFVTDIPMVAVSDGTNWIRLDTGATL